MYSTNSNIANKRKEKDVMKLLVSNYQVKVLDEERNNEFLIRMEGPTDSPYEGVGYIYNHDNLTFLGFMVSQGSFTF